MPILKKENVAYRVYRAMMYGEKEVYIPSYTYWMGVVMLLIPSVRLRIWIIQTLMGNGMKTLNTNLNKKKL